MNKHHHHTTRHTKRRGRGAFTLVELLVAILITSLLATAMFAALDTSLKAYNTTGESSTTQTSARIVMQRITSMIRTGRDFGPYPVNPLLNPNLSTDRLQFESFSDETTGEQRIDILERRGVVGAYELWHIADQYQSGVLIQRLEQPLLSNLVDLRFDLRYDVGPRLRRATIDMVLLPDATRDAAIAADIGAPAMRLIASASPRTVED